MNDMGQKDKGHNPRRHIHRLQKRAVWFRFGQQILQSPTTVGHGEKFRLTFFEVEKRHFRSKKAIFRSYSIIKNMKKFGNP